MSQAPSRGREQTQRPANSSREARRKNHVPMPLAQHKIHPRLSLAAALESMAACDLATPEFRARGRLDET